jgi:hypothetical protein
LASSLEEGLSK